MKLTDSHIIIQSSSVKEAKQWIEKNDVDYFNSYSGDCYLICDNPHRWEKIVARPRKVTSTLLQPGVLGFHLLAEIKNNAVYNQKTLDTWFTRTLAHIQSNLDNKLLARVFSQLTKWGMLHIEGDNYKITRLGRVSAMLYYFPSDVFHWSKNFSIIDEQNLWKSDLAFSYVLGTTPELDLPYVPKAEKETVEDYTDAVAKIWPGDYSELKKSVIASKLYNLLTLGDKSPMVRNIQFDSERIAQACQWIDGINSWHQPSFWSALPVRLKYGVGQELVELCSLPGIGGVRAQKLYASDIKTIKDVLNKKSIVQKIIGNDLARKIIKAIELQNA